LSIREALNTIDTKKCTTALTDFGKGNSAQLFLKVMKEKAIWQLNQQKQFKDL
jgi:UDP-N-acetylglucosamine 2-epimerase (hydrolysing)